MIAPTAVKHGMPLICAFSWSVGERDFDRKILGLSGVLMGWASSRLSFLVIFSMYLLWDRLWFFPNSLEWPWCQAGSQPHQDLQSWKFSSCHPLAFAFCLVNLWPCTCHQYVLKLWMCQDLWSWCQLTETLSYPLSVMAQCRHWFQPHVACIRP